MPKSSPARTSISTSRPRQIFAVSLVRGVRRTKASVPNCVQRANGAVLGAAGTGTVLSENWTVRGASSPGSMSDDGMKEQEAKCGRPVQVNAT